MKYYLAIKQNEVLIYATTWMDFGNIVKEAGHKDHKKGNLCEISRLGKL